MDTKPKLHPAQTNILFHLRHNPEARYTELMRTTSLESDVFKFHIRKLMSLGLLVKTDTGYYQLTPIGKEYANRIDEKNRREITFPKTSMLIALSCETDGQTYYLAQRRKRDPFVGHWGMLSGPLVQGQLLIDAAKAELLKQTGIKANLQVQGTIRTIDKDGHGTVLEDKLFTVLSGVLPTMEAPHQWHGGDSVWMTRDELLACEPLFSTTLHILRLLDTQERFIEAVQTHAAGKY